MAWQFHLEVDARRIEQWPVGHTGELAQAGIPTQRLREQAKMHGAGIEQSLRRFMNQWLTMQDV